MNIINQLFQNAKLYPKFATFIVAVYGAGAGIAGLLSILFVGTPGAFFFHVALGLFIVFFADVVIYFVVAADSERTNAFLAAINKIEGFVSDDSGQDVAEYAVMLAVIIVIAVGTIHLIGSSAGNVFSEIGSKIQ